MNNLVNLGRLVGCSFVALTALGGSAHADLFSAGTFKNVTYSQVGSVISPTGGFFNALATENGVGDYDSASLSVNGGPAIDLPLSGTTFSNGPSFATKADMDAAFPFGTYAITATGGGGPQTVTLDYSLDAYAAGIPALEAASYAALQGLNTASSPFDVAFNSFTPDSNSTAAFTFFTIFGTSQFCDFLSPSATSCTIDPSALLPGTTYDFELDFSDRIETKGTTFTYTDFDVRTEGSFTTASLTLPPTGVPEPLTLSLFGAGIAGVAAMRRRKKV